MSAERGQDELESIVAELLAAAIDDFTSARNARVARLKASGNKELAAAVQSLRRPPAPLWAVNQLARDKDVLERVRRATLAAVEAQAGGSASDLRSATAQMQRALEDASHAAGEVLRAAGQAASAASMLRARELIRVAAVEGGDTWERLAGGRLIQEPGPPSNVMAFAGPPAGATPRSAAPASRRSDKARLARRQAQADAQAAEQARTMAARLRDEADRLAEQARQASERATEAEDAAARAQQRADESMREAEATGAD